jgi:hypothetical protein
MRELAASLKDEPSMLVFGRGQNYATALETALKACFHCLRMPVLFVVALIKSASAFWSFYSSLPVVLTACGSITDQGGGTDSQRGRAGGGDEARHPRPGGRDAAHPRGAAPQCTLCRVPCAAGAQASCF